MRYLLIFRVLILLSFLLLLFSCKTKPPKSNLKLIGTWISHDCILKINDTSGGNIDSLLCDVNAIEFCSITRHMDSLIIKRKYRFDQNIETNTYKYGFIIEKQTDSFLNLKLVSGNAENLGLKLDSTIKFVRDKYLIDKTIKFKKIIFLARSGFGLSSWLNLEIDSNQEMLFEANLDDKSRSGNFKGYLNDSIYKQLINILQTCDLKNLKTNNIIELDNGSEVIIAYFNNQRKAILYYEPPIILNRLINFFNTVYKVCYIHRTSEKFDIDADYWQNHVISRPK